jgi:hypothetical protein
MLQIKEYKTWLLRRQLYLHIEPLMLSLNPDPGLNPDLKLNLSHKP